MASFLDIFTVRGGDEGIARVPALTAAREQITSQGFPTRTEMSRLGWGWRGIDTSATAAVVVRPSTVAGLTLWNGSTDKVYVIDQVGAFNLVTTDAVEAWSVWECLHPTLAAVTADITAIKGYSGNAYSGNARLDTGATVTDDGWFPVSPFGVVGNSSTTTPGNALVHDRDGRILVKPGAGYSINVVASLVGQTFTHYISWYEVPIGLLSLQ